MYAILKAQLQKQRRNPASMIMMIGLTILFTVMLGINTTSKVTVYTYHDEYIEEASAAHWLDRLNSSASFAFELVDETEARHKVIDGEAMFALKLLDDDYRIIASVDNTNIAMLETYVRAVYDEELAYEAVDHILPAAEVREQIASRMAEPVLSVHSTEVETEDGFEYDTRIQSLFGFSLFFAIYTIASAVNALLYDKKNRIWDRVILSPVSKTSMYIGHLMHSFLLGYIQIVLVFSLFQYAFDFPLGDSFLTILVIAAVYTFAIVALSMLMASLVRTPQQMNVLTPIVAVSSAMIGGAYWPIEIVTNPVLLALSKLVPITYGMEALKGVAYYTYTWADLLQPLSSLCLIGVICMGLGINLMERRSA